MDKKYLQLLTEIARAMPVLAEQVMDFNHEKKDEKGLATAQTMRDDYQNLYDRMTESNFTPQSLNRTDYAKLLVGAFVISQNIEDKIKMQQKALNGYKLDLIPKLDKIVSNSTNDKEAFENAEENFQIIDEIK